MRAERMGGDWNKWHAMWGWSTAYCGQSTSGNIQFNLWQLVPDTDKCKRCVAALERKKK